MLEQFDTLSITRFHAITLDEESGTVPTAGPLSRAVWQAIATDRRYNTLLWDEEDRARRTDVGPIAIAASKRLIDQYNQRRNDAVEQIKALLAQLETAPPGPDARLHSETAGAMIDRLSILSLKILHMREQACRHDATEVHRARCGDKLQRLVIQREDLAGCLNQLLAEVRQGRAYFKLYRQFKMHNDPALNPYLYRRPAAVAP